MVINCVITEETIDDAMKVVNFCIDEDIAFAPVPANRGKGLMHRFQEIRNMER